MGKEKTSTKSSQNVSGIVALLDTPVIEGYEIKEWNIKQFALLYPYLKEVMATLVKQGMSLDNAEEYLQNNYVDIADAIIPILPELLRISLNLDAEEVEKIPVTTGTILCFAILEKNMEHAKSFLAQVKGSQRVQDQTQPTT